MPSLSLPRPSSRRLRWGVPVAAAVVLVGVGPAVAVITADAHGSLPPRTAAQLLTDVHGAKLQALSGTVVETSDLGLPALPAVGGRGGDSASFSSLVSGSHTMRLWYAGPDRLRLALLGQLGESDLVRNGTDVWAWSSHDNTATHWTVPAGREGAPLTPDASAGPAMTPQQAAEAALKAINPSTRVTTDPTAEVAGRPATSAVGSVVTRVDGLIAFSAASAACCGVIAGPAEASGVSGAPSRPAGTVQWVAVLSWLDHAHTSVPLRTRSDSPSWPSRASRSRSGPAYHRRIVCEPDTSEEKLALSPPRPPTAGSAGSPRSEVSTTVPESACSFAPCTSVRSWAAVRGGSDPWASAVITATAGPTPTSTTAAATGTPQRRRRDEGRGSERLGMGPWSLAGAVSPLRTCDHRQPGPPYRLHGVTG